MVLVRTLSDAPKPLIMVCGKYGCGKTTSARALARELEGFHHVGIDETRQRMGLVPYDAADNPKILRQMDIRVRSSLRDGFGVIVDRPHQTFMSRMRTYEAAHLFGRPIILIECVCPEIVARSRIAARPSSVTVHLPSNNPAIYDRIKRNWQDVSEDFKMEPDMALHLAHLRYHTDQPKAALIRVPEGIREMAERICRLLDGIRPADEEKER